MHPFHLKNESFLTKNTALINIKLEDIRIAAGFLFFQSIALIRIRITCINFYLGEFLW